MVLETLSKNFGVVVRDSVKTNAAIKTRITTENIAGVMKPTFTLKGDDMVEDDIIGITGGG